MKIAVAIFLTAFLALSLTVYVQGVQICSYPNANCPDSEGQGTCCGNVDPGSSQCCNFGSRRASVRWFFSGCGNCVGASWPSNGCSGGNLGGVGGGQNFCLSFQGQQPSSANAFFSGQLSSLEESFLNGTATKPPSFAANCVEADQAFYDKDGVRTWLYIPQGQLHHVNLLLENKDYTALESFGLQAAL